MVTVSTITPIVRRYPVKTSIPCVRTYRNSPPITISPTTNDATMPATNAICSSAGMPSLTRWRSFRTPAPAVIGIDSRKLNRVAAGRVKPSNSPAVNVIPDRETPGANARACAHPMITANGSPIRSIPLR